MVILNKLVVVVVVVVLVSRPLIKDVEPHVRKLSTSLEIFQVSEDPENTY